MEKQTNRQRVYYHKVILIHTTHLSKSTAMSENIQLNYALRDCGCNFGAVGGHTWLVGTTPLKKNKHCLQSIQQYTHAKNTCDDIDGE